METYWDTALGTITSYPWTVNSIGVAIAVVTILALGILGLKVILGIVFFLVAFIIGYDLD